MERAILQKLLDWKNSPYRKPLILKGVRQVGKTWVLKEFGRRYYENTAYFNFDENEEYKQFFETTKDVDRILQNLMLASGQKILPEKTLIIFDEVQDCPKVINSMKYFCENAPQYHIACAGSLLGIALAKPSSFPVGKVNFMQIDPMTFWLPMGTKIWQNTWKPWRNWNRSPMRFLTPFMKSSRCTMSPAECRRLC